MQASQAEVVSKSRVKSHFSIPFDVRSSILLFHSFIQHCFSPKEEGRRERERGEHLSLFQSHSILLTSYEESRRRRRRTSRFTSEKKDVDHREEGEGGRAGGRQAGKKNDFDTEWRRRAAIQSRRKPSARQMRWCSVAAAAAADGQREARPECDAVH